jgi:GNAT superfamily N-acetyltransferase
LDIDTIGSVAIHPEYQKQGLRRRLLAGAEQQAAQAGYRSIRLYTNECMEDNIRLNKSLCYQETRREQRPGTAVVHMAKKLEK